MTGYEDRSVEIIGLIAWSESVGTDRAAIGGGNGEVYEGKDGEGVRHRPL